MQVHCVGNKRSLFKSFFFRCKFKLNKLGKSKISYFLQFAGWILRRNLSMEVRENLDYRMQWLQSYGFTLKSIRKNEGLFTTEIMEKPCEANNTLISNYADYDARMLSKCRDFNEEKLDTIELKHIKLILMIWAGGISCGVFIFLVELLLNKELI